MQVDKICFTNFVDLAHLAHLPWLISQPSVASTMIIYELPLENKLIIVNVIHELHKNSFTKNIYIWLVVSLICLRNFQQNIPWWWELGHNLLLSLTFWWESPWWWDLGHNLLLSQAFQWESLWRWDFRLPRSLWLARSLSKNFPLSWWNFGYHGAFSWTFLFHIGISAITEPFHKFFYMMEFWLSRSLLTNFSFIQWNSGYHEAFSRTFLSHDGILAITKPSHELFFHTMDFWLSQSLFMNFSFSQWNLGYHRAFSRNFYTCWNSGYHEAFSWTFLSYNGVLPITKPSHELFFHTMEFWLSRSLLMNFFFFTLESRLSWSLFTNHNGIHKMRDLWEASFHI
jgi:hypothetical protein